MLIYMITFILNGVKDSKCIVCSCIDIAIESIDGKAFILETEKLY
jgi:hypothetical protein